MNDQIKNSFDLVSLQKLARDTAILFGPALALYLLQALETYDFGDLTPIISLLISFAISAIKRYRQGQPEPF